MHLLLIINPSSGGAGRNTLNLLEWTALLAGHQLDIVAPSTPEGTRAAARRGVREAYDRILVAGGDGTINCVVSELLDTSVPLGVIPVGTVNVLARECAIPLDATQAMHTALHGQVRRMDVGCANGNAFILMAGLGFDAAVIAEIVPRMKEIFGSLAYVTTGLQVLTHYKPSTFRITVDDNPPFALTAWLLIVGNARSYAYDLAVSPDASMDDGKLDVCVFAEESGLDRLAQIGAVFVGQHLRHPNVSVFHATALHIDADPPVAVQLDGDTAGTSPVEISVRPQALCVMVP